MQQMIFINLPVADVARATMFYEAMGATRNPQFCDERTSMMVLSETIYVMLLSRSRFAEFTSRPVADAHATAQVLLALSVESRSAVDDLADRAVPAGGSVDPCPRQDHGWMYGRSFEDPDGHIWEVIWMDEVSTMAEHADAPA